MTTEETVHPLIVHEVEKTFQQGEKKITALAKLSLTVPAGQFLAIMGASGSGKSTLMHAIAGLIDVDQGEVRIAGQNLGVLSDKALTRFRRAQVGLVFQSFNLIPALTAEQNVRLPAAGVPDLANRLDQLFDRLGIAERRDHRPGALSGGEQQRVAIARALIRDPAILLADEPTGSLDSETGQAMCRLLRQLCDQQARTIVVVTHEPSVAMWADRVVVLRDGRCQADFPVDTPQDPAWLTRQYQAALASQGQQEQLEEVDA